MVLLDLLVLQDPLDPLDLVVDSALLNFKLSSNLDLKVKTPHSLRAFLSIFTILEFFTSSEIVFSGPAAAAAASDDPYSIPESMRNDPSLRVMGSVGKWVNEKIAKGTKEFPARTCKDLFKNNPTFTDGK